MQSGPEVSNGIEVGSTQRFRPGKLKWFFVTLLGAMFVAGGIFMLLQGEKDAMAWATIGFFGLVTLIGIAQLIGWGSWLELRADSFTMCSMGRKTEIRWDECSDFGVGSVGHNKTIMFNRKRDMKSAMGKVAKALSGATGSLPDTYGMKAEELADLMNAYRDNALNKP